MKKGRFYQDAALHLKPLLRSIQDELGIDRPLPFPADMTFRVFTRAQWDDDNIITARKICLDVMQRLNFIVDDSPKWVRSHDLPCEVDRQSPRTVIILKRQTS
jgi:hypothetical protein